MNKTHFVQSPEWGIFKEKFGNKVITAGGIQCSLHSVPKTNFRYAYAPKVKLANVDLEAMIKELNKQNCFVLNFDVPYVIKGSKEEKDWVNALEKSSYKIKKSTKNTFTQNNIILDITPDEENLLENMHKKHRYNIRYAQRKGVKTRYARTEKDFDIFYKLIEDTAKRQRFLIHPREYYKKLWEILAPRQMAEIIIAEYKGTPLTAWMLFIKDDILYYPYGASSEEFKNLQASTLVGWEAIKYGKSRNCDTFDMWGACKNINDESDPEWGFTNFKMRFGGEYVTYMDSYDVILKPFIYKCFNFAYPKALKLLKFLKR